MKFLGGLLKVLSILIMLADTAVCAIVIAIEGIQNGYEEAIWVMSLVWLGVLFVAITILATGMALSQLAKAKKRIELLEAQVLFLAKKAAELSGAKEAAAKPAAATAAAFQPAEPAPIYPFPGGPTPTAAAPIYPFPGGPTATEQEPAPFFDEATQFAVTADAPKKKRSKVWIPIVIAAAVVLVAVILILSLGGKSPASDGGSGDSNDGFLSGIVEEPAVMCPMTVDGVFVDDSYEGKENKSLKMVYLFYTLTAQDKNLQIDSKYTKMHIGENVYESDHFADEAQACKFAVSYYYGSYIEDVYVGESKKVVATFYVPEGDLTGGKTVTFEDSQIPGLEAIRLNTDEFQHAGSPEEIACIVDAGGFEQNMYDREKADDATTKKVRELLNGKTWSFYVNNMAYELSFAKKNKFTVKTSFSENSGTYSVRNGFIFCTYPDTEYTVEIPYKIVDGKMDLDTIGGFDVMQ